MVEVLHGKIPQGQEELCNNLYDLKVGTIEKGVKCKTCSMDCTKCKVSLWLHFAGCACCQSYLIKTTQMDSEVYLQEMQKDSGNKATSLDQKLHVGCIVFSLFGSTNIFSIIPMCTRPF